MFLRKYLQAYPAYRQLEEIPEMEYKQSRLLALTIFLIIMHIYTLDKIFLMLQKGKIQVFSALQIDIFFKLILQVLWVTQVFYWKEQTTQFFQM